MRFFLIISILSFTQILSGCVTPTNVNEAARSLTTATTTQKFADGTKAIVVNTKVGAGGSFTDPLAVPAAATVIPSPFPGANGIATYQKGLSADTYYAVDGTTTTKPSWLLDFQLGITALAGTAASCATFGTNGSFDVADTYRIAEANCQGAGYNGTGTKDDRVFMRILLDRDTSKIGSAENLLVQINYQASSIQHATVGVTAVVDDNVDQLWKVFWNTTLTSAFKPFAYFIPPNYSACIPSTGAVAAPGGCLTNYHGSPVKSRQFVIPLSAYPTMSVIQINRVKAKNTAGYIDPFLNDPGTFCGIESPLCFGVVVRSVSLMRF